MYASVYVSFVSICEATWELTRAHVRVNNSKLSDSRRRGPAVTGVLDDGSVPSIARITRPMYTADVGVADS